MLCVTHSAGTKLDRLGTFIENMHDQKNELALGSGSSLSSEASEIQTSHDKIRTYEELQRQILNALRDQNPHWIEPDGSSPIFESYQKRLAELLAFFGQQERRRVPLPGRSASLFLTEESDPLLIL
jgi:hypothetical protein